MGEEQKTVVESLLQWADDDGYDVPFSTFTWARWLEMQTQVMQRFSRFQRAIDHNEPATAMQVAIEMQEMAMDWLREAINLMESL